MKTVLFDTGDSRDKKWQFEDPYMIGIPMQNLYRLTEKTPGFSIPGPFSQINFKDLSKST